MKKILAYIVIPVMVCGSAMAQLATNSMTIQGYRLVDNGSSVSFAAGTTQSFANISIGGTARTNWPTTTEATLYRYDAYAAEPNTVWVFASGSGITATRSGNTFSFNIPAGTRIFSAKIRVDGGNTIAGVIYVSVGNNDMNQAALTTMWIPVVAACREDSYANVPVTSIIHSGDTTMTKVSGLGSVGGITYHVELRF